MDPLLSLSFPSSFPLLSPLSSLPSSLTIDTGSPYNGVPGSSSWLLSAYVPHPLFSPPLPLILLLNSRTHFSYLWLSRWPPIPPRQPPIQRSSSWCLRRYVLLPSPFSPLPSPLSPLPSPLSPLPSPLSPLPSPLSPLPSPLSPLPSPLSSLYLLLFSWYLLPRWPPIPPPPHLLLNVT